MALDMGGRACEPPRAVWSRLLFVLAATTLVTGLLMGLAIRMAYAQAPPASFFDGRSNDELRVLATDRHNDVLLRRAAATRLVMTLADEGDVDGADAAARELAGNIDIFAVKHARAVRRRGRAHAVSVGALGVALVIAGGSLIAARRSLPAAVKALRAVAPVVVIFLLFVGLAGGVLASSYENGSALPFVLFAAFMLPLVVIFRMWSAVGSPSRRARALRGLAAVVATLAVGFLVVEHVNPSYLDGFGL
jgi:hypothetical protein